MKILINEIQMDSGEVIEIHDSKKEFSVLINANGFSIKKEG